MSSTKVCPFEWRYASREMRRVFSEYKRLNIMARVELALLRGLVKAGLVPEKVVEDIGKDIELTEEDILQLREIEKRVKHETVALIELLSKKYEKLGAYIHLGATSNDIIDTTWSLLIREALGIVEVKIAELLRAMVRLADEHVDTVMVGRTHGQQALPITLGFKLMNHAYEISLCLERLLESHRRLFVLKMSGAVGTMA
ncbi:MAG: adenylosuccinate lyase, partial [Thermoprotei archaeon]